MSVYPSSISYTNPTVQNIQFKTLFTKFSDLGTENRKAKWAYPKRSFVLKYSALSKADAEVLWQFYLDRQGSYADFVFFESTGVGDNYTYTKEYVGTGDSTTAVFNLFIPINFLLLFFLPSSPIFDFKTCLLNIINSFDLEAKEL